GLAPDIPRFDLFAFGFYITLEKVPVTVTRLAVFNEQAIANNDYILISEKDQGFQPGSDFTSDLKLINEYVRSRTDIFHMLDSFALPNGDIIHLYKVGSA